MKPLYKHESDEVSRQKKNQIKGWTKYTPINTADSVENGFRVIYREPWGFFLLINGNWAFMGRASGRENKSLCLFAEGQQTIARNYVGLPYQPVV